MKQIYVVMETEWRVDETVSSSPMVVCATPELADEWVMDHMRSMVCQHVCTYQKWEIEKMFQSFDVEPVVYYD